MRSKKTKQSEVRASRFQWSEGDVEFHPSREISPKEDAPKRVLLSGKELNEAIRQVCAGKRVSCAVAFWGKGASQLLGASRERELRVICNLKMGGTNPLAIDSLMSAGVATKQCDSLHAKVYIGERDAVVTSANASINGLGLQGDELAGWIETGVVVPADAALPWFDVLWEQSREIRRPADIRAALITFKGRQAIRPTRSSFAQFDTEAEDIPLVSWVGNPSYDYNERQIKEQIGAFNESIRRRIDNGVDIEGPEDRSISPGTWVLYWRISDNGRPNRRIKPWWTCMSDSIVDNAIRYNDKSESTNVILEAEVRPPEPFDPSEQKFRHAFFDVLESPKYAEFRQTDYEGSFLAPRRKLMERFWQDVRTRYDQSA